MIKKSDLPASWQSTDGYNKFYWNVPGYYTNDRNTVKCPRYSCFEFTLDRACDQAYSIEYLFTWERSKYDSNHILVNY